MPKTGPQKYPGANLARWYQGVYPGDAMEANTIVWHSTEGTSLPSYSGGSMAPNFTAVPNWDKERLDWYQHFDFDVSARALVHAGSVATNTLNVCQVEIVGTCDPATHTKWGSTKHLYMPELPDWVIRDLAAFAKWAHEQHGVPLTSDVSWKAYPASYGANGVRLSNAKWLDFSGHCGHQHVPSGNVHGDPGLFPMSAILTAAKSGTTEEDDVALSTDDINKIASAVATKLIAGGGVLEEGDLDRILTTLLKTDDVLAAPTDATDYATNKAWTWLAHVQATTVAARHAASQADVIAAQARANGEALSKILAVLADPAGDFAAKLTAVLTGLDFKVVSTTS